MLGVELCKPEIILGLMEEESIINCDYPWLATHVESESVDSSLIEILGEEDVF